MRLQHRATIQDFINAQNHGIYFGQKGGNGSSPLTPHVLFYPVLANKSIDLDKIKYLYDALL